MRSNITEQIENKIRENHNGDERQLEVIFSSAPRIIVEAPAGYGKTTTMISRIAYLYVTGRIPNPKKILGLTFSVNAALKVKREVAEKLPRLLGDANNPVAVSDKITVTNYHGFCKGVLKKYGHLISDLLRKDINLLKAVGKSDIEKSRLIQEFFSYDELVQIYSIEEQISNADMPSPDQISKYNEIILERLLPHDYITHDSVLLLTIELFNRCPQIRDFYSNYYPLIVVDEFQDTNCMAWELLKCIIGERTNLLFLGDPLQRIYGFIGALSRIMETAANEYNMKTISLDRNYRFKDNLEMLRLDFNIRANAASVFCPDHLESAVTPAFWGISQEDEAKKVIKNISQLQSLGDNSRVAILFRGRGENAEVFESCLREQSMPFFYGMFTDDDPEYIDFHNYCRNVFVQRFAKSFSINKRQLTSFANKVKTEYKPVDAKISDSLFKLLDALVYKIATDYSDLQPEEKYELLLDIFENRQLKQAMEYVDSDLILSTVHGAKGLEWDYVFIADLERWSFPGYYVCKDCPQRFSTAVKGKCSLQIPVESNRIDIMLDELSVFYVAVTRARKQVFLSASAQKANGKQGVFSCMISIDGIQIRNAEE